MSNKYEAAAGGIDETALTTLVAERFAQIMHVTPEMLYGVEIQTAHHVLADSLAVRLAKDVYGEKLRPETAHASASVPATWWQHYRFAHRSAWWLRWHVKRWPIRLEQIEMTATWDNYVMYPWAQLRGSTPDYLGDPVRQTRPPVIQVQQPVNFSEWMKRQPRG